MDMEFKQLDVKTIFLHGRLEEDILIQQPEGFEVEGKENYVGRLKKSLYGLQQSPRQWYKRFYDSCVYHSKVEDGSHINLLLNVDDM